MLMNQLDLLEQANSVEFFYSMDIPLTNLYKTLSILPIVNSMEPSTLSPSIDRPKWSQRLLFNFQIHSTSTFHVNHSIAITTTWYWLNDKSTSSFPWPKPRGQDLTPFTTSGTRSWRGAQLAIDSLAAVSLWCSWKKERNDGLFRFQALTVVAKTYGRFMVDGVDPRDLYIYIYIPRLCTKPAHGMEGALGEKEYPSLRGRFIYGSFYSRHPRHRTWLHGTFSAEPREKYSSHEQELVYQKSGKILMRG